MSIMEGFENHSMNVDNPPVSFQGNAILQQKLKCIDDRIGIIEMQMGEIVTAVSQNSMLLNQVLSAVGRNAMLLNQVFSAVFEQSKQAPRELSAQLNGLQATRNSSSSSSTSSSSLGGSLMHSDESVQGQVAEIEQVNNAQVNNSQAIRNSSSSSSSYSGSLMRNDGNANMLNKTIELESSSGESIIVERQKKSVPVDNKVSKFGQAPKKSVPVDNKASKFTQAPSLIAGSKVQAESDIISDVEFDYPLENGTFSQKPAKTAEKSPPMTIHKFSGKRDKEEQTEAGEKPSKHSKSPINPRNVVTFKNAKLFEWTQGIKDLKPLGEGELEVQKGGQTVAIKFMSSGKQLNYWMEAGSELKNVNKKSISLMFKCFENVQCEGISKVLVSTLSSPADTNKLILFLN